MVSKTFHVFYTYFDVFLTFLTFFLQNPKRDFLRFLLCCILFLEHCLLLLVPYLLLLLLLVLTFCCSESCVDFHCCCVSADLVICCCILVVSFDSTCSTLSYTWNSFSNSSVSIARAEPAAVAEPAAAASAATRCWSRRPLADVDSSSDRRCSSWSSHVVADLRCGSSDDRESSPLSIVSSRRKTDCR